MRNGDDDPVVTNASSRLLLAMQGDNSTADNCPDSQSKLRSFYSQPIMISPGFTIKITFLPS